MVRRMDASVHRLFSDIETILHSSKDLSVVSLSLSERPLVNYTLFSQEELAGRGDRGREKLL